MECELQNKIVQLKGKIKSYPDFPKKGILFWDIFSALSDGASCKLLQDILVKTVKTKFPDVDALVGLESRGFLFMFSIAAELGIACIPVRKTGKLPGEVVSYNYEKEYGSDTLQIQKASMKPGLRCLIIDDLIATGGSVNAAYSLLKSCGADVTGCLAIIELLALNGRDKLPKDLRLHSLIQYD